MSTGLHCLNPMSCEIETKKANTYNEQSPSSSSGTQQGYILYSVGYKPSLSFYVRSIKPATFDFTMQRYKKISICQNVGVSFNLY